MDKREAYEQKLKAELDKVRAEIDKLKAEASAADADARIERDRLIAELEDKRHHAQRKLEELNKAGEGAWGDLKEGAASAWRELSRALEDASSRFGRRD